MSIGVGAERPGLPTRTPERECSIGRGDAASIGLGAPLDGLESPGRVSSSPTVRRCLCPGPLPTDVDRS